MNINLAMLEDGLVVLCVGFFVVFMFLTILIFAMQIMGAVVAWLNKVFPVAAPVAAPAKITSDGDAEVAVAIAAALLKQNH